MGRCVIAFKSKGQQAEGGEHVYPACWNLGERPKGQLVIKEYPRE